MASETYDHNATKTTEALLLETRGWTHIVAVLESSADGVNEFGYGGTYSVIEPGTTINHIVAPGTRVNIKCTSPTGSKWAIMITELSFIDSMINILCSLGGK